MRNKYFLVPILFVLFGCVQDSPNVQQISNMKFFIENQSYDGINIIEPGLQYAVLELSLIHI